ncbi:hypothetical protein D9M68_803420 [compost metagenome]
MVQVELFGQAQGDLAGHALRVAFGQQAAAPFGQMRADGFIGRGVAHELVQAPFQFAVAFAQRHDLAFA